MHRVQAYGTSNIPARMPETYGLDHRLTVMTQHRGDFAEFVILPESVPDRCRASLKERQLLRSAGRRQAEYACTRGR